MKSRIIVVGAKNASGAPSTPPAGIAAALWEAAGKAGGGRTAFLLRLFGFKLLGVKGSSSHCDLPYLKGRSCVSLL